MVGGWAIKVPCFAVLLPLCVFQCSWLPLDSGSRLVCVGSDSWFPIGLPPFNKLCLNIFQVPVARFEHAGTLRFQSRSRRLPFGQASAVQNMSIFFFVGTFGAACDFWRQLVMFEKLCRHMITCVEQDQHVTSNGFSMCSYATCL